MFAQLGMLFAFQVPYIGSFHSVVGVLHIVVLVGVIHIVPHREDILAPYVKCSMMQCNVFIVNILLLSSVLYLQYGTRRDLTGVRIFRVTYALSTTYGNISAEVTMCSHCSEMYIRYNRHFG